MEISEEYILSIKEFGNYIDDNTRKVAEHLRLESNMKSIEDFNENHKKEIKNQFGVYCFFIRYKANKKITKKKFEDEWDKKGFKKYPKIIKDRYQYSNLNYKTFIPFYIGKSETIGKRIFEHINHSPKITTSGLKLKERSFLKDTLDIRVSWWKLPEIDVTDKSIKQFIITRIESKLRESIKPWVSKQ